MHTLNVIAAGLILLGFFLLVGRFVGGSRAAMATAAKYFIPVWLPLPQSTCGPGFHKRDIPFAMRPRYCSWYSQSPLPRPCLLHGATALNQGSR